MMDHNYDNDSSQTYSHSHSHTGSGDSSTSACRSPLSSVHPHQLSPLPTGNEGEMSIPSSPSASTFLRTAETLEGLARQLGQVDQDTTTTLAGGGEVRCCCGNLIGMGTGCKMSKEREKLEDKLKLSGEIGHALLQRYEALERKSQRDIEKYERQLEAKRTALVDSVKRVHNLEKANHTHLQKYAEMSRKTEALEKRYTQAMHTQTLTQQSLTHVRAELTTLRATNARQNIALASGAGVESQLADAEKRYEEARDATEAEERTARDELRKRKRAEARIAELQEQLAAASKDVEEIREAKAREASDLLANAKERLEVLHTELSETFRTESPSEMPEYQRALESLVANNALLKHDTAELSHSLADSRDEVRTLKEEIEELRAAIGVVGRTSTSPIGTFPQRLATELGQTGSSHSRTESSPILHWQQGQGHGDRMGWQRFSAASSNRTGISPWEHHRKMSMAPSFASTSTADGLTSPGLGMGPIGEFGGVLVNEDGPRVGALSPPLAGERESPKPIFRTSPSGGIGYVLNGVPKKPGARPAVSRSFSGDRRGMRGFHSQRVGSIAEWSGAEEESGNNTNDEPTSPGTEYFRAAEVNRKRRSLMLARRSTMSPNEYTDYSPNASQTLVDASVADYPSPMSDSALTGTSPKRAKRKTLLLLTRSMGVQTDAIDEGVERIIAVGTGPKEKEKEKTSESNRTSPNPPTEDQSETSSIHAADSRAGALLVLIEQVSRILSKVRSADVHTLNKRLKKAHLPGDVGHLSQSTLRNLQTEIADLKNSFRGTSTQNLGGVDKRDFNLLLRVFKDVFNDLVELQAVVNDVTITPSLAKKLRTEAFRDDEEVKPAASGLGWIAAPLTKFFVTPAESENANSDQQSTSSNKGGVGRGIERGRLQPVPPAVKAAPKQQAIASATTTHVSVEFGGTGIVRRATPASASQSQPSVPSSGSGDLPSSPNGPIGDYSNRTVSASAAKSTEGSLLPPGMRTLRPSKSRANRNELLGIFAGASASQARPSTSSTPGGIGIEPWTVLPHAAPGAGGKTIRAVSSGYFERERTVRQQTQPVQSRKLPKAVDAVIDSSASQLEDDPHSGITSQGFEPRLLERTLRPRGLSDSSIRSTFVSQSHSSEGGIIGVDANIGIGGLPGRAGAYVPDPNTNASGGGGGGGILQNLQKRWYGRSNEVSPINPDPAPDPRPISDPSLNSIPSESTKSEVEPSTTSTMTMARSPPHSASSRSSSISTISRHHDRDRTTSASHQSQQSGLLGMIASSLADTAEMAEYDEDEAAGVGVGEMVGATLRQKPVRGKSWRS